MNGAELSDEALMAALRAQPELRERVSSIVRAVEGEGGELKEADAAEERIVEEMRLLGREALRSWAENRVEATERDIRQRPRMHRQGEENSAGIRKFGQIEVREPQYRLGKRRVRPFVLEAKVSPLGCSAAAATSSSISPPINPSRKPAPSCRSTTASRSAINRINGDWDAYWKALAQASPAVANDNNPQKSLPRSA